MVYIYTLSTEDDPNNIRYVGKTNETLHRRLKRHLSPSYLNENNNYKNNWLKKLLKENRKPIIKIIDEVSEDDWVFWEQYWISQFISWGFKLTNTTIGGEGIILTKEIIEKRNESNRNSLKRKLAYKKLTTYTLNCIEKFNVRKKDDIWSAERKCPNNCGNIMKYKRNDRSGLLSGLRKAEKENRKCYSCNTSGEKNYFYGKKLNDGDEKRKRLGKNVLQYEKNGNFVKEYESIREASEETLIDRKSISRCCKKMKHYNSAGGFNWKFKENNNE